MSKKEKTVKEKKPRIRKVGTRKPLVICLWLLFIFVFAFAIYKNFTAVDTHTVTEKTIIEKEVVDTHGIENFVTNFAKAYYTWGQSTDELKSRTSLLGYYLSAELQTLNNDAVRADIPVSSTVSQVQLWSITQSAEQEYTVVFTVTQVLNNGEYSYSIPSTYETTVYLDENGDMVIIKNPTLCAKPAKSDYEPKAAESDGSVNSATMAEIKEFLNTFFKLYPSASASELSYYVNDGVLDAIGKDYYIFSELVSPTFRISTENENQVLVHVSVKYLDQQTYITQISQFSLVLEKTSGTWKIIDKY